MILAQERSEDRRRKRSSDPLVALHYQLAHTRTEGQFEAVVVADDSGVVVAGAGTWAVCEELAAYAPLLAVAQQGQARGPHRRDPSGALPAGSRVAAISVEVDVQPVQVDGQTVLLCARGVRAEADAMQRAARGVARILGEPSLLACSK